MYRIILLALLVISCSDEVKEPVFEIEKIGDLDADLLESSGIAFYNGKIFTHADSRDQLNLIEIDKSGSSVQSITLPQLPRLRDWEDIEISNDTLYVGDIGNNLGRRRDLAVYAYKFDGTTAVDMTKFPYEYADQQVFDRTAYNETSHDAEALAVIDDKAYILSKDWQTLNSTIYQLDLSTPDVLQQLQPLETLNMGGLVTGATHTSNPKKIIVCGYNIALAPFVARISITDDGFKLQEKVMLSELLQGSSQIEGITYAGTDDNDIDTFYLTSERFEKTVFRKSIELEAALYKLRWR
ncbi:hypothetical protein [Nonlabens ponticola]|uniref:Uncharacterized protein n=1 Tax=Nonlabens ponticola TaxID=2496866 RepID=A0A3S9MWC9_9FLAO|nr:hypothetical protein [Nonlabens ponticola]AZQ43437.1 hypothetical protein EJ995_04010 [Nonlabens ponticola]